MLRASGKPEIKEEKIFFKATAIEQDAPQKPTCRSPAFLNDLCALLAKIGVMTLTFALLFTFLYGVIRYREPGMAPTVKDGDLVFFYRYIGAGYLPRDVVALGYNGVKQVRRVIAAAGDTVDITEDGLFINGALQQETEILRKTERYQEGVSFPLTVPAGQVFVLGDSREDAEDSRMYGCVKIEDTFGKVMIIVRRRGI